jgi:hypothetical protein
MWMRASRRRSDLKREAHLTAARQIAQMLVTDMKTMQGILKRKPAEDPIDYLNRVENGLADMDRERQFNAMWGGKP